MKFKRSSAILLHPTSLPGKQGIGTLGKEAYKFIDFLIQAGQKLWQICPIGPTGYGDSPYASFSAFAGNPFLIDLEDLIEKSYLEESDIEFLKDFSNEKVEYEKVYNTKFNILKKAYEKCKKSKDDIFQEKFENFINNNNYWIEDYAMFMAIKHHFSGKSWEEWDDDIRLREKDAMEKYSMILKDEIDFLKFVQYIFFDQWNRLKTYANNNFIQIIGDIPIYVAMDSSDAWANPEVFLFNEDRKPIAVAGVPPDYFSATGQLWGNPLYNWEYMEKEGFSWWLNRIKLNREIADILRFDHFRGFAAYWAVPAKDNTAINGVWEQAKGYELFEKIVETYGDINMIAEDLGTITPDVLKLRDDFSFPGMKILQFAFDTEEGNNALPHEYIQNTTVYTGSHDNDTIKGWFDNASVKDKEYAKKYINSDGKDIVWDLIRAAWASVSVIAVTNLQDILELGSEARMNTPGTLGGNWEWRYKDGDLTQELVDKLKKITEIYMR